MVICLERGADLHMAQLMPLPLTVTCFSKIQIGFTFLVPAHPGSPGQRAVKRVCVCVCVPPLASAARCGPPPLATPLVRRRMRWPSKVTQRCYSNVPSVDLAFAMQITRCALKIGRGPALMARINIHEARCVPLGLICVFMHGRSSRVLIAGASATPVRTQNSFIR